MPGGDFRQGHLEDLPFADESFDVVTGFNSFQYAGNAVRAMEHVSEDAVTEAYAKAIAALRQPDGSVRASTWCRCLLARP